MEVRRVKFEAFKSLYDVSCELDRFTVITGPNGSGKSNLVDGLNFLGEVYADGLEFAVGRAGGYENIAHRRTRRATRPVALEVEVRLDADDVRRASPFYRIRGGSDSTPIPDDASLTYHHSFSFGTSGQSLLSDFEVRSDNASLRAPDGRALVSMTRDDSGKFTSRVARKAIKSTAWINMMTEPFGDSNFDRFIRERPFPQTSLVTEAMSYSGASGTVIRAIGKTRLFQLSPYQCRTAGVPTPNAALERHGENLPGAADHLRRNAPDSWHRVQSAMRSIMPGLQGIEIAYTEDRRLALQFRESGIGRPWTTGEVSDGTIQALALFIALYDERNPLLVIEEPENSVHPWILRQFLDLCAEEKRKQIIVTTHSPVVLNYVEPASVRLMHMSEGRSQISPLLDLSPEVRDLVLSGEITLFDAYDSGVLQQAVPRGFAPNAPWGE